MTPDQVKEYVDATFRQRDSFTILYFIAAPVLTLLAAFVGAYSLKRGENAATKKDIGEITDKIQNATSVYTERLEQLRGDLLARSHFSKVRYEREVKIYDEVWPRLYELKEAVLSLRPPIEGGFQQGESEEDRIRAKATRFGDAANEFVRTVEHSRPFYPDEIWSELRSLLNLCWREAFDFRHTERRDDPTGYWKKADANAKAISGYVDQICDAIRTRLTKFDAV